MRERLALLVAILSTSVYATALVDPAHLAAYAVVFAVCLTATAFVAVPSTGLGRATRAFFVACAHSDRSAGDIAALLVVNRR